MSWGGFPRIVLTDEQCVIDDVSYIGLPVLFDKDGVMKAPSDYLRFRYIETGVFQSSLYQMACCLRKFYKHIEDKNIEWDMVHDAHLERWRQYMLSKEGEDIEAGTARDVISNVFDFYVWCEMNGRLNHHVCIYDVNHNDRNKKIYSISTRKTGRNRGGKSFHNYVWPYLPDVPGRPNRYTPTPQEIEEAHVEAFNSSVGERDSLVMSFYEEGGLRVSELLNMDVSEIPLLEEIEELMETGEILQLSVFGKRRKTRHVPILPELLERTREYIDGYRAEIIRKCKKKNVAFIEPSKIFISVNGASLNRKYLSDRISKILRKIGVKNASGHRIRARAVCNVIAAYDGYNEDGSLYDSRTVLIKAAEFLGHNDWETLRPYLALSRSPDFKSKATIQYEQTIRLNETKRNVEKNISTLKDVKQLNDVAILLRKGHKNKAAELLGDMYDNLSGATK